ncbi:MAG: hypothetical protein K2P52_08440 [Campylobacterales bacterium]|nr:hypothetical protein [Campylobacterales bacterium]
MSVQELLVPNDYHLFANELNVNTLDVINISATNITTVNETVTGTLTANDIHTVNETITGTLTGNIINATTETISGVLTAGSLITNTIKSKPGNTLNIQTTGTDPVQVGSATNDVILGSGAGGIVRIKGVAYPPQQHYASLQWTTIQGVVTTVNSGDSMPWNNVAVNGGVTFNNINGELTVDSNANGYYLVNFGYSNIRVVGAGGFHPQSFSLKINGVISDKYTLQEMWNNVPASATDLSNSGQSSTAIVLLFPNSTISLVNSLVSAIDFENKVSTVAIGAVGACNTYLTIMRMI